MKYITATTEKRIMKAASRDSFGFWENTQAGTLAAILDEIKSSYGWFGCSVAEAKKLGQQFDNADQLRGFSHRASVLFGWTVNYPEYESRARAILADHNKDWKAQDEEIENLLREFCAQA